MYLCCWLAFVFYSFIPIQTEYECAFLFPNYLSYVHLKTFTAHFRQNLFDFIVNISIICISLSFVSNSISVAFFYWYYPFLSCTGAIVRQHCSINWSITVYLFQAEIFRWERSATCEQNLSNDLYRNICSAITMWYNAINNYRNRKRICPTLD